MQYFVARLNINTPAPSIFICPPLNIYIYIKVSVTCRLPTIPLKNLKKNAVETPSNDRLLGVTQYYCYTRSEYKAESSSMWIYTLQSIDCFCSSRRLIASLLASIALVRRRYCSCSYSRPFRFSRRLFLLFSSINSFSSRQLCSSPSIVSALLVARSASVRRLFMLFSSINRFSSRQFHSSPSISSALLMNGFGRS